jgi:hypothetical protein
MDPVGSGIMRADVSGHVTLGGTGLRLTLLCPVFIGSLSGSEIVFPSLSLHSKIQSFMTRLPVL